MWNRCVCSINHSFIIGHQSFCPLFWQIAVKRLRRVFLFLAFWSEILETTAQKPFFCIACGQIYLLSCGIFKWKHFAISAGCAIWGDTPDQQTLLYWQYFFPLLLRKACYKINLAIVFIIFCCCRNLWLVCIWSANSSAPNVFPYIVDIGDFLHASRRTNCCDGIWCFCLLCAFFSLFWVIS